jgi:hypothetical protein
MDLANGKLQAITNTYNLLRSAEHRVFKATSRANKAQQFLVNKIKENMKLRRRLSAVQAALQAVLEGKNDA